MAHGLKKPDSMSRAIVNVNVRADDENFDAEVAHQLLRPEVQSAALIQVLEGNTHEVNAVVGELAAQTQRIHTNDMQRVESILISQAHALDALFANLGRRALKNMKGGYLDAGDRYLRLALKAQSQCRTTLESLAEIKNPRAVAFVKQQNVANGPQQVNNGTPASSDSRTSTRTYAHAQENSANQSNELLEAQHGNYVEQGTAGTAVGANSEMAALGKFNGTPD